jgi:hypothetical protein
MKLRAYIAGPISKGDLAANIRQADEAFFRLLRAGLAPFCPHWSCYSGGPYDAPTPQANPGGVSQAGWVAADLPWVAVADLVLRLPGESSGADREVALAKQLSIPVFDDIEELIAATRHPEEWLTP